MTKKTSKDKKAITVDWLNTHGYPLELRAARIFSDLKYGITQGEYYDDPLEHKPREIDLISQKLVKSRNNTSQARLQFVVECKSLKGDQAWLLFRNSAKVNELIKFYPRNQESKHANSNLDLAYEIGSNGFLHEEISHGYAVTVSKRDQNQDIAYKALNSVSAATIAYKDRPLGLFSIPNKVNLHYRIPLILTNVEIYEVQLDEENNINLLDLDYCCLTQSIESSHDKLPIFIVKETATEKLVNLIESEMTTLLDACNENSEIYLKESVSTKKFLDSVKR